MFRGLLLVAFLALGWQCAEGRETEKAGVGRPVGKEAGASDTLRLGVRVVESFPHDPTASTQGLLWFGGRLYESTGLWGRSSVRQVDLETGEVRLKVDLEPHLFGEGLARVGSDLWQLTWQNGLAIRYAADSLEARDQRQYRGEGWGLCFDGVDLWRSDGSSRLRRHETESFEEIGFIDVEREAKPLTNLNELECAEGWIYANVWQTEQIVRIDPASGNVLAVIDASGLLPSSVRQNAGVLNGIAYRPESQTFLLTGKSWPRLFEVVFVETR